MFGKVFLLEMIILSAAELTRSQHLEKLTTCEEFEVGAYFNPYEILDSVWKIFYFWANTTEVYPIVFSLPSKKKIDKIRATVDAVDPDLDIEWNRATLLMDPRPDLTVIFLYATTPGAFRAVVKLDRRSAIQPHPLPLIKFADIRMKQVGKYIGMMCCEDMTAYALSRVDYMPATEEECVKEAKLLGIELPNAHSYLYVKRLMEEL